MVNPLIISTQKDNTSLLGRITWEEQNEGNQVNYRLMTCARENYVE